MSSDEEAFKKMAAREESSRAAFATVKQHIKYARQATHWYEEQNPSRAFSRHRAVAIEAVMEFLANSEGRTIYGAAEGREIRAYKS